MDDPPEAQGGTAEEASPARPTPVSARDAFTPPAARRKPTPARALVDADAADPTGSDESAEEVWFRVDDGSVVARALGRSGRSGSTPLLLIGFWQGGEAGDGGDGEKDRPDAAVDGAGHVRETLVVARALSDLGEDALCAAWHGGREPPAPPGAPPRRNEQRRRR